MERDERGKPPAGEFSSFDLSKMGAARVAAEMAARMARWRSAHKGDAPAGAPHAGEPMSDPPAAPPPAAEPPAPPRELDAAVAARLHRALRIAARAQALNTERTAARSARRADSYGGDFDSLLAEGPNMNAIGMSPEPDAAEAPRPAPAIGAGVQEAGAAAWRTRPRALAARMMDEARTRARAAGLAARDSCAAAHQALRPALDKGMDRARRGLRAARVRERGTAAWRAWRSMLESGFDRAWIHARAIGGAARRARADWLAVAGAAAIAIAVAAWLLVLPDRTAAPERTRQAETRPPAAAAPPERAQLPRIEPPRIEPPRAVTGPPAIPASAEVARPLAPAPDARASETMETAAPMPARLKPEMRAPALAVRLKPGTATRSDAPQAAQPPNAAQARQRQQSAGDGGKDSDPRAMDGLLDQMFSDGLGHRLSRRRAGAAPDAPPM